MKAALKAEFRKFLTVRSTYIVSLLVLVLAGFLSIYAFGIESGQESFNNPQYLIQPMSAVLSIFATFTSILAILLVAHEYRYNTISYTLTAARSRINVVLAKMAVMATYALVGGAVVVAIGYFGTILGANIAGDHVVAQQIDWLEKFWQFAAYSVGYALAGLIIALIIRSLVGALAFFFVFPIVGEISTIVLHENVRFLPFRSLDAILGVPFQGIPVDMLAPTSAALLAYSYLTIAAVSACALFVRRDAN